jgi:hypothetical protein
MRYKTLIVKNTHSALTAFPEESFARIEKDPDGKWRLFVDNIPTLLHEITTMEALRGYWLKQDKEVGEFLESCELVILEVKIV